MATQPTSEQLKFCEPAIYFNLEAWIDEGRALVKHGKNLANQEDRRQWDIGDWLIAGEDGGVKTKVLKTRAFKKHALEITKRKSWQVLKNLKSIAANVEESRRRDGREGRKFLSYAIHVRVAKFDAETQELLLGMADDGDPRLLHRDGTHGAFSDRRFKQVIADMQERGEIPKTGKDKSPKKAPEGYTVLKISVPDGFYSQLRSWVLSAVGGQEIRTPASLFAWFASKYVKEHRAELDAVVAAARVESAAIQKRCEDELAARTARNAAEAEERKKAGLPNPLEFEEYRKRCVKLNGFLRKADKNALLMPYLRRAIGVQDFGFATSYATCNVTCHQWEDVLGKLEAVGDPEAALQLVNSAI